jgi:DNA mismatch repair ATPase MutS
MPQINDSLTLDAATLIDLEVLSTSTANGPTLLKLIDRTRTRAGRENLRRRLASPLRRASEIVALQAAHQELADDAAAFDAILRASCADDVERYLNSNWQIPSARRGMARLAGLVWNPPWYRDYVAFADRGRQHAMALLDAAHALRKCLSASKSALLQDAGESLARAVDCAEIRTLEQTARRQSSRARDRFDDIARDAAKPALLDIIARFGTIESWWSVGVAASEHHWAYPIPGSHLRIVGLVHPFLGDSAIRNDLRLSGDVRVCFVTGPNMGGKSTFLKAIALAMTLAQCGAAVPAISMEFEPVGTIFSSVQLSDNLAAGESFYLAEVRRIRDLALALVTGDSAIAILDEPFRGTNAHDAADATVAIIQRLVDHNNSLVFIASHIAEVVPSISADRRVSLMHFSADVSNGRPTFDYTIRQGVSTQRLGMTLLKQEGVLDLLARRPSSVAVTPGSS